MIEADTGTEGSGRWTLVPHPAHPPSSVLSVRVEIARTVERIAIIYLIEGAEALVVPDMAAPVRADELWKTTCFELFQQCEEDASYFEFNFSPSTRWAAYRFESYREGMSEAGVGVPPGVSHTVDGDRFLIEVDLVPGDAMPRGDWRIGLTAVIEEQGGTKSFWALDHGPGAPDFHNRDCFTARLAAPERA